MIRILGRTVAGLLLTGHASADWALSMPEDATVLSAGTHALHLQIFYGCCAIALAVFVAMIWSHVTHRSAAGLDGRTRSEIAWAAIPIAIMLLMAVPASETLVGFDDAREPDLTIAVTGNQWKWHYAYRGEAVSFYSDRPLVVPQGAGVRILLSSNDVLHSWSVPRLAIKEYAVPGLTNETWLRAGETGLYHGRCGMDHRAAPIVIEVLEQEAFRAWLGDEKGRSRQLAAMEVGSD